MSNTHHPSLQCFCQSRVLWWKLQIWSIFCPRWFSSPPVCLQGHQTPCLLWYQLILKLILLLMYAEIIGSVSASYIPHGPGDPATIDQALAPVPVALTLYCSLPLIHNHLEGLSETLLFICSINSEAVWFNNTKADGTHSIFIPFEADGFWSALCKVKQWLVPKPWTLTPPAALADSFFFFLNVGSNTFELFHPGLGGVSHLHSSTFKEVKCPNV